MQLTNFHLTITRKKIKNMYLRVHPDGTVSVSAPKRLSDKAIREFVNSKTDWIETQLQKLEQKKGTKQSQELNYLTGELHDYWGCPCKLLVEESTGKSSVEFVENPNFGKEISSEEVDTSVFGILHMQVSANSTVEQRKHLLEEFYREKLKLLVPELLEKYIPVVGKAPRVAHPQHENPLGHL